VLATYSEKLETFLDPLERRSGIFAPRDLHVVLAKHSTEKIGVRFCSLTPAAGLVLPAGWWLAGFGFLAVGSLEKSGYLRIHCSTVASYESTTTKIR
jgi:hypothetical protein